MCEAACGQPVVVQVREVGRVLVIGNRSMVTFTAGHGGVVLKRQGLSYGM